MESTQNEFTLRDKIAITVYIVAFIAVLGVFSFCSMFLTKAILPREEYEAIVMAGPPFHLFIMWWFPASLFPIWCAIVNGWSWIRAIRATLLVLLCCFGLLAIANLIGHKFGDGQPPEERARLLSEIKSYSPIRHIA